MLGSNLVLVLETGQSMRTWGMVVWNQRKGMESILLIDLFSLILLCLDMKYIDLE